MEFDEIVVKESPGLCRCCLSEGCYKDLGSEYTWMNDNEVYADMLLECFDISITQHNEGPNGPNRLICEVCITRLRDACNFKKQVLESEKKFIDMVARGDFRPKVLIYQAQMKSEDNVEEVNVEEVEYLEDEIDFGDDEPLKREDPTESTACKITAEPLPVKGKRGRPRKTDVKNEKRVKVAKTEDKPRTSKAVAKDGRAIHSANYHRRRNLQILFNNTSLIPFKWRMKYMCFYCGCDIDSYDDLKTHTKSHGFCSDRDRAIRLVKSPDSEVKIDVSKVSCKLCNQSFPNFEEIVSHLVHKHNLPYNKDVDLTIATYRLIDLKCLSCEEKFKYFRQLVSHMNSKHPSNCFTCSNCNQRFNKKRDLHHHARVQHRNCYTCTKCSESFTSNSELQHHRKNSHISTCNICFKTFSSDSKRLSHMKRDHKTDGAECGFCHKVMTTKQGFLRHAAQCTAKEDSKIYDTIIVDDDKKQSVKEIRNDIACVFNLSSALPFKYFMNKFRCFYCSKDFTKCDALKQHTSIEHPHCDIRFKSMRLRNRYEGMQIKVDTSSLSCKVCFESVSDLESLFDHLIVEHKTRFDKSVRNHLQEFKLIEENFACPYCVEVYRYFGLLLRHVSGTHTDNKYICTYCGKSFRTNPNLRAHVFSWHNNMARHKCDYCSLVFTTNNNLKVHLGRAHGSKVVQCTECSEKFTTHYWMRRHMLDAHGAGHKCSYCGRTYVKNSAMVNHVRRFHFKEKNVECSVCSERFFDAQRLKIHMVKHVGERNFHCDICGKKFLWKKNLRGHMSSHNKNCSNKLSTGEPRGGQNARTEKSESVIDDKYEDIIVTQSTNKRLTAKDKRQIMRNNVIQVLTKSTIMPFRWLKSSYRCFYCYDIFQEASELKSHQIHHPGDEVKEQAMNNYWESVVYVDISNLACKLCAETITDLYDLIDHLVAKHGAVYNKDVGICMVAFKLDNFSTNCLACGATFYTFGPLLHHTNKDHKGTSAILCDVCGQHFKDANLLKLHVKTVHEKTGLLCPECGEKFETKSKLKTHQKNLHDVDKKYKCLVCTLTFQSHYKRSRHMAAEHNNRQEIKCLHCPKTFVFRSMMMTHLRDTHLRVRNHTCGVCGWKAFNRTRLKNHMYKHSGEKNFKCDACDKAFTTKKIMRAHYVRMHKNIQQPVLHYDNPYIGH